VTEAAATSTAEAPPPPAAPPLPDQAAHLDIDALVDKVQRKLMRRLAAERERRGGFA
jgi:hypothetical protein